MKSQLLLSKILSYCSSPKLESPVTSVALGQSQVSQSLKVTSWCLESGSKVKMDYQPIPGLVERFQALCVGFTQTEQNPHALTLKGKIVAYQKITPLFLDYFF